MTLLLAAMAAPVFGSEAPAAGPVEVTTDSIKYLDEDDEIRFAASWEEVPEAYRAPRHWSTASWCGEGSPVVEQSIELVDLDVDGEREVLVYFDDECPNKRRFATLEVIEDDGVGGYSIVLTATATRGYRPEPLDLDGDGRLEIVGFHWADAPELWVLDDGEYVDLIRGGSCYGSFWKEGAAKPRAPPEETYARVLELFRRGECLRTWLPGSAP